MGRNRKFDEATVLSRALDVFWQRGFEGASVTEICEATGLNPGSLYALHENKYGLYLAAMRRYLEDVVEEGCGQIEASPSGVAGIRGYFDYVAEGIVEGKRRWGCMGTNGFIEMGSRDAEVQAVMAAHFERLRGAFQEALERDGVANAPSLAGYLVCVAQGMNVLARTGPDRAALDAIIDTAFTAIPGSPRA